jgi:hypothetical protein
LFFPFIKSSNPLYRFIMPFFKTIVPFMLAVLSMLINGFPCQVSDNFEFLVEFVQFGIDARMVAGIIITFNAKLSLPFRFFMSCLAHFIRPAFPAGLVPPSLFFCMTISENKHQYISPRFLNLYDFKLEYLCIKFNESENFGAHGIERSLQWGYIMIIGISSSARSDPLVSE